MRTTRPCVGWIGRKFGVRFLLRSGFLAASALTFCVFLVAELPVAASVLLVFSALGATMLAFLAAVIWITLDLRIKGLALEASSSAGQPPTDLVFGTHEGDPGTSLSEPLQVAIARAAGLVTIGSTLFAIAWSYRQHGPAAEAARAESAYRRSLRQLARSRKKQARRNKAVVIAALTNIAGFGTLTLGSYPALRSFGLVALIGSITCLFTALTLVPAVMARRD